MMPAADMEERLVAIGRALRDTLAAPPTSPEGLALRAQCAVPAWSEVLDDLAFVVEARVRAIGEAIDAHAETGALDSADVRRQRDDLESLRRALEEIERRAEDTPAAERLGGELDALVTDLRDADAWARRLGLRWQDEPQATRS